MKKALSFLTFLLFAFTATHTAMGQTFTITSSDRGHISLRFELGDFSIDTVRHDGEVMHTITTKGIVMPNDYGLPELPTFNRFIAIPQGARAVVEVRTSRDDRISGINIEPSIGSQAENDPERPFFKDSKVYASNAFYPAENHLVAKPQQLRGVDVIHLGLCPFQFNPVTHELAVHRTMDIDIRFEGGNGHFGDDRLRSRYWDPILRNTILNHDCLEPIDYDARMQQWSQTRPSGCEYLIVTPDNDAYFNAARELADYRNKQGIYTKAMRVTETGATDFRDLKQWFRYIFANWDIVPVAVCLMGESGDDLQQYVPGHPALHPKDNVITSDNPYADVNDDWLPDMCFTRLIAQNESELPLFVGKQLEYEYTNPVQNLYYYQHPLTAAGWQNNKWFQLCIATISCYLEQHGKTPTRINEIYDGDLGPNWSTAAGTNDVVAYFGPDGIGRVPASPHDLGGWTGGNAEQVIHAINSGAYLIQHRDHGWNTKWYQPEIYTSDFSSINNVGKMTYLISINCRTGMFDNSTTCFIESLLRMTRNGQNAGIVGAIGPSAQTYSFANDIFLWGVWDLLESDFLPDHGPYGTHSDTWMPSFACVAGKYFLDAQVFPSTDESMRNATYNTFHTHGDAFLRVFTDMPQTITATHDASIQCFEPFHITAPEGSEIALTYHLGRHWHILATATGTGADQTITILQNVPTNNIHLTVTGHNLLRLEEDIPLVPYDRPFIVVDSVALNGGGFLMPYNQSVAADINVTNIGLQNCNGGTVSMTTTSNQLNVVQGNATFGTLASNGSQYLNNAFQFTISDDVRDHVLLPFVLTSNFNGESYSQEYEIEVMAPNIMAHFIGIDDATGNDDGHLDPGEFARIVFNVDNNGHFRADHPHITLSNEEGLLRVITPEITLDDMEVGATAQISFEVYAEYSAGEVPYVDLHLLTAINGIRLEQDFSCPIGFVLENFEASIFDPIYWNNDPQHPWTLDHTLPYDGEYCARSAAIDHDESSEMTFTFTSTDPGEITFFRRISSENNYDFLVFYIDGEEQARWSGDYGWRGFTYPAPAGQHTYKWAYIKDYSVNSGSDAAWIDYITLPPHLDDLEEATGELPLTLHPNPTTDLVAIGLEQEGDYVVNVFDADGKLVQSKRNTDVVSFAGLPAGLYHIVVEQNGQRWSRKIVKM